MTQNSAQKQDIQATREHRGAHRASVSGVKKTLISGRTRRWMGGAFMVLAGFALACVHTAIEDSDKGKRRDRQPGTSPAVTAVGSPEAATRTQDTTREPPRSDESYPKSDSETWFIARILQPSAPGELVELNQEEVTRGFRGTFSNPLASAGRLRGWGLSAFFSQLRVLRFTAKTRMELRNADAYASVAQASPDITSMIDNYRQHLPPPNFQPDAALEIVVSRSRKDGNSTEKYLIYEPATGIHMFIFSFGG